MIMSPQATSIIRDPTRKRESLARQNGGHVILRAEGSFTQTLGSTATRRIVGMRGRLWGHTAVSSLTVAERKGMW
ncbi:hypothetical protein GLOTRDRAFT_112441 [Gloeophyllum trabeum ATCC 11539]|uniref:Uncharacterized protein n=1 Tax=Gloeophyllum trabeum (strain ATCC 11539 / FP-39264 / Madison 617) TaxID=670483 RepID=S7PVW0_GLOTA|nr:uncharacterized protein GLOTRDRAFT_112441 [Gloeophyllum trabeum ATCC 11539]EPQ51658.1 hypothetical protein GLOTRDRAFT_112441 [Gloeophyllum trabeum ATCC 11539]